VLSTARNKPGSENDADNVRVYGPAANKQCALRQHWTCNM